MNTFFLRFSRSLGTGAKHPVDLTRGTRVYSTSPRNLWSVWMDSNHRPRAYQARALATWATDRFCSRFQGSRHLGGDDGNRTHDPLLAGQVLSQLSYTPKGFILFKDLSKSLWKLNNTCEQYLPKVSRLPSFGFNLLTIRHIRDNMSVSP